MHAARALAVVTGARRGIGAAIAIDLAAQGFDLAITDLGPEGADATLDAIGAHGGRARFFASDLAEVGAHPALVDAITDWGGPIVALVNNAGIGSPRRGDLLEVPPQAFDRVLGVNLRGTFFMTQAVARHMLQTPAPAAAPARSIVTLSSVSADMASVERAEYCLSKSGLSMLTKLFALRLAAAGIGVFEIRPGVIRTPMTQAVSADYDQRIAQGLVPMHRWGQPDDVARAVRALALGQLAFASGSVLCVDGALSIPRL
ncbi:3-ketoacyl-ACP reductase [Verminephrobacter aporrectodeae subsp. tuberculatae]|uniref:3-ketoacyl-ACP reductase n=1 Tax=Verminephrobacter aporrectodeae TaxID=1110389 RepID=UPI0022387038|nr:3-ketoacyl-ACP reductase [Verminephrobacter aporrectodeae]MCW5255142.1 3-ketoacyl-ACP reductase [Verminephrobacter aporrectodeae subsp. tuberculatae]MCW8165417.1 3-ketoacyl-ACP reductase [Verminephrobacter aporrectodeae subsp. tuberculatae]MCW8169509.1 3-ketoacyl-ACP reductase [Verminephrobacter aporrectodeae subsp. tuberculatae]MCW8206210.1 3-ketoacyl-ACP reductase [Verminephrobacter aporrectodeae subsp. tuberculatae]